MLLLALYLAAMVGLVLRLSRSLALLSWASRTSDSRLALHCGRNPYDVSMPFVTNLPLYRWSRS